MKVILLKDVAKIGRRSQVVEVPDGYALNQLIPKGMAEAATAVNMRRIERKQSEVAAQKAKDEAKFTEVVTALKATKLTMPVEANEQGHLFKAINEKDVAEAARALGVKAEDGMFVVTTPIKEVGTHQVEMVQGEQKEVIELEVVKKT